MSKLKIAVGVVMIALVCVLIGKRSNRNHLGVVPAGTSDTGSSRAVDSQGSVGDRGLQASVPALPVENPHGVLPDVGQVSMGDRRILEVNSFLKGFNQLARKVLRTQQEQRDLEEMISNQKRLDQIYLYLSSRQALDQTRRQETMVTRMLAVDYLARAAEFEKNPIREDVVQSIKNLLITDDLVSLKDDASREVVIGDQVELYSVLKDSSPQVAGDLARLSRGTRLAKVIALANGLYPKN